MLRVNADEKMTFIIQTWGPDKMQQNLEKKAQKIQTYIGILMSPQLGLVVCIAKPNIW